MWLRAKIDCTTSHSSPAVNPIAHTSPRSQRFLPDTTMVEHESAGDVAVLAQKVGSGPSAAQLRKMIEERKLSAIRTRVYNLLLDIPEGKVTTYKLLAQAMNIRSPRAVGQALKHNPFAPDVPCHRVIRTDLTIGGFHGQTSGPQISKKIRLLKAEGVKVDNAGKLQDRAQLHAFRTKAE